MYISSQMISKPVSVDFHLCTTCGYFEVYVTDQVKLEQVAKDAALGQPKGWERVGLN